MQFHSKLGVFKPFSCGISQKVYVIARLEFELARYNIVFQQFNPYATGSLPFVVEFWSVKYMTVQLNHRP